MNDNKVYIVATYRIDSRGMIYTIPRKAFYDYGNAKEYKNELYLQGDYCSIITMPESDWLNWD